MGEASAKVTARKKRRELWNRSLDTTTANFKHWSVNTLHNTQYPGQDMMVCGQNLSDRPDDPANTNMPPSQTPKRLNTDPLTLSIHAERHDVTSPKPSPYPPDCLILSFEILEPSLDKLYDLPMDLLDLGRFLSRVS